MKQINRLRFARVIWVVLAVSYLAIWFASLPGFYARVSTLTIEPFRLGERVIFDNAIAAQEATQRGVSLANSAAIDMASGLLQVVVYYAVAAIILVRATNGFGVFTAFVLMLMGVTNMAGVVGVASLFAGALFLVEIPGYLVWPLWLLWLYLFPNGQPIPRKSGLPVGVLFVLFMVSSGLSLLGAFSIIPPHIDTATASLSPILILPLFGFILFAQIYRYTRVSNSIERQQTKWFLFGVGIFFLTVVVFAIAPDTIRTSAVIQDLLLIAFLIFPVSVAFAILRYRLFDIDIIIRRTLTYAIVVAMLATVYFGSVILLQQVFASLTGARSEVITVLSTLAIAVLFIPLRNRVQNAIDKRFNRQRYDAQQVLQKFAVTVRDETDLDKLTSELVNVVQETMQPKRVSVWLKQEKRDK